MAAAVPLPSILWRLHSRERWDFQSPTRHVGIDRDADGHSLGETEGSDETWEESFGHVPVPTLLLSLAAGLAGELWAAILSGVSSRRLRFPHERLAATRHEDSALQRGDALQ